MAFWTPEADQFIADCAALGLSATIAAAKLGQGVTRNAVIGRAFRIGVFFKSGNNAWTREPKPRGKYKPREKKVRPLKEPKHKKHRFTFGSGFTKAPDSMKTPPVAIQEAPTPKDLPRAVALGAADAVQALEDLDCRWPIGDVQDKQFRFCGARREQGHPYCSHHHSYAHAGGRTYDDKADSEEET